MTKRVLLISYDFPPTGGSGVQRVAKFANYLPRFGWQPFVLTVDRSTENYIDRSLLSDVSPDVFIIRTPSNEPGFIAPFSRRSWGKFLLRASLFPDIHALWKRSAIKAGMQLIKEHNIQAIYSTEPPTGHLIGYELCKNTGLPWLMDLRDLWTLSYTYRPVSYLHGRLDSRLESKMVHLASAITCVTEGLKRELTHFYTDLDPNKINVIRNGYDEADFKTIEPHRSDCFTMLHSGILYPFSVRSRPTGWKKYFEPLTHGAGSATMARSPAGLLEAIGEFIQEHPDAEDHFQVIFLGDFPEKFKELISTNHLEKIVKIMGYVEHRQSVQQVVNANVLFLIQSGRGADVAVPAKLYEYMRSGNAVLAIMPEGECTEIIQKSRTGVVIDTEKKEEIKAHIGRWYQSWLAGQALINPNWDYIRGFERERQTEQLSDVLNKIA